MAEKLRIESLNVRGLRDKHKRLDILDRAKQRQADIILLQETHWIEADYTYMRGLEYRSTNCRGVNNSKGHSNTAE